MPEPRQYINYTLFTDVEPYEVIEMNAKGTRAKVRKLNAKLDPTWKPEWVPGGFAGHCTNNREQRWVFSEDPEGEVRQMSLRLKNTAAEHWQFVGEPTSRCIGSKGRLSDQPRKFHDYNF